jgi:hypothetical protein
MGSVGVRMDEPTACPVGPIPHGAWSRNDSPNAHQGEVIRHFRTVRDVANVALAHGKRSPIQSRK